MKKSVIEWLEYTTSSKPDKIALCDETRSINYSQVLRDAKSIGSFILETIGSKNSIVIISNREVKTLVTYLGVIYSGGHYVPIDAMNPQSHIRKIITTTNPKMILINKQSLSVLNDIDYQGKVVLLEDIDQYPINEYLLKSVKKEVIDIDPLYIIFTSGSTGTPKGVVTSHRAIDTFVQGYISAIGINENDIIGSQSPLDYVGVVKDFYTSLKLGATMFIIPKKCFVTTNILIDFLIEFKITVIAWTVAALTIPISNGAFDEKVPESLRLVCFTGSVMPSKYLRILQEKLLNTEFVNLYGPTELASNCMFYKVKSKVADDYVIPIGLSFEGYRTLIVNDRGEEAQVEEVGELLVGGSAICLGYYNNSELSNQYFVQNPLHNQYRDLVYKTGDYCFLQADGNCIFVGRKDRMVKSHGYRIELDEIESILMSLEDVNSCSCIYNKKDDQLYLYYDGMIEKKQLIIIMRKELLSYKVPRKIFKIEKMPLMNNFKVDISKLKTMMEDYD